MPRRTAFVALLITTTWSAHAEWRGSWIWHPAEGLTDVYARISVDLPSAPVRARCAVTADNRYILYVNGKEAGRDSSWSSLEEYDLAPYLRLGHNVVAIHGGDDGSGAAGILLDGLVWCENGEVVAIATGPQTRVRSEWDRDWNEPEYDDSAWIPARVHGGVPMQPWGDFPRPAWFQRKARITGWGWLGSNQPGEIGAATMTLVLDGPLPSRAPVDLVFLLDDQEAWVVRAEPQPPIEAWPSVKPFEVLFPEIALPITLPRVNLAVVPRITDVEMEGQAEFWFGERPLVAPPVEAMLSRVQLQQASRSLDLAVQFRPRANVPPDLRWYVALYRGRELWFADSFVPARETTGWRPGQWHEEQVVAALPPLPAGTYRVVAGLHTAPNPFREEIALTLASDTGRYERPYGYGTFVDKYRTPHFWYINPYGTLIWDGAPYIPVGGMVLPRWASREADTGAWLYDLETLSQMRKAGITDIYFNPCVRAIDHPTRVWQSLFDVAEEAGVCYAWDFPMHVAPLDAFHIESRDYLVEANEQGQASVFIPSGYFGRTEPGNRVLYAAFNPQRATLLETGYAQVTPGREGLVARATVRHPEARGSVVHFVPELRFRGDMHDYWTGVTDRYLEEIRRMLRRLKPGPRFRGFIDPLDNEQSFRDQQRMLPSCRAFRAQLALWLAERYGQVQQLAQAWAVDPAPSSFTEAAQLVPVGGNFRSAPDVGWAVGIDNGAHYRVDLDRSQMWDDMLQFRDNSIRDYNNLLADVVKSVIDAPVLMKLTELDAFTNNQTVGGFDALGLEAYSDAPELVRGCGGGVYARSVQSARTMWMLVTETALARKDIARIGYPDPLRLVYELASMVEYGARGTYYFVFIRGGDSAWEVFNLFGDPRQLAWMGAFSEIMKRSRDLPTHRPWVDFSFPQKQVGSGGFRRADPDYAGTPPHVSVQTRNGRWVVPVETLPGIDPLTSNARLIVNLERSPATVRYRPVLQRALSSGWPVVMVGLRHDRGALPVDIFYTGEFARDADQRVVQVVEPPENAAVTHRTPDGKPFGFRMESLSVIAKEDWDHVVRQLEGDPRTRGVEEFVETVLNAEYLDLGPAFQGIRTGDATFVWTLADEDVTITVRADAPMTLFTLGTGDRVDGGRRATLTLSAKAGKTVQIECAEPLHFEGTDPVNAEFVQPVWEELAGRARETGLTVPDLTGQEWRTVAQAVNHWKQVLADAERTLHIPRVQGIHIDGDLADWQNVEEKPFTRWKDKDMVQEIDPLPNTGVRFGHNDQGLYVAVRVGDEHVFNNHHGATLWNGDAFELFVETHLETEHTDRAYDSDCFHLVFAPTSADKTPAQVLLGHPAKRSGMPLESVEWMVKRDAVGWTLEALLPPAALNGYTPRPGDVIGWSYALSDSDGGDRERLYPWRNEVGMSEDRLQFGRAVLQE